MDEVAAAHLLSEAESRYHLKVFDNISEVHLSQKPLSVRLEIVGRAVMERTDLEGFYLGRRLVQLSREFTETIDAH